jgi:hypothetical protein
MIALKRFVAPVVVIAVTLAVFIASVNRL